MQTTKTKRSPESGWHLKLLKYFLFFLLGGGGEMKLLPHFAWHFLFVQCKLTRTSMNTLESCRKQRGDFVVNHFYFLMGHCGS